MSLSLGQQTSNGRYLQIASFESVRHREGVLAKTSKLAYVFAGGYDEAILFNGYLFDGMSHGNL